MYTYKQILDTLKYLSEQNINMSNKVFKGTREANNLNIELFLRMWDTFYTSPSAIKISML